MLGHESVTAPSAPPRPAYVIIACSATSYSCCCQTTCSKLMSCQLIVYDGGGGGVVNNGGSDNDVGGSDWLLECADSVLDSLPDSYSDSNVFLCKD